MSAHDYLIAEADGEFKEPVFQTIPDEILFQALTYLPAADLASVARVNRNWKNLAYDEALWQCMDLGPIFFKVDDRFLANMLQSRRFRGLKTLRLDGCTAVSMETFNVIVDTVGKSLQELSLINCSQIEPYAVESLVSRLPQLRRLELYGVTQDWLLVERLLLISPFLDLGYFYLLYCASTGQEPITAAEREAARQIDDIQWRQPDELGLEQETLRTQEGRFRRWSILSQRTDATERGVQTLTRPLRSALHREAGEDESKEHDGGSRDQEHHSLIPRRPSSSAPQFGEEQARRRRASIPAAMPAPLPPPRSAQCRHADGFNERACWGPVRGRILYTSSRSRRPGNFPDSVLFSCRMHMESDFTDPDHFDCRSCERLFLDHDMQTSLICKVCWDEQQLQQDRNWIRLTRENLDRFSFGDICSRTIRIADRRNLPPTLRVYGRQLCTLDYALPDPPSDSELSPLGRRAQEAAEPAEPSVSPRRIPRDPRVQPPPGPPPPGLRPVARPELPPPARAVSPRVPVPVFLDANRNMINEQVDAIRQKLTRAMEARETRALLVVEDDEEVSVMADQCAILDPRGQQNLELMQLAWSQARGILLPFVVVMLMCIYFISANRRENDRDTWSGVINYTHLLKEPSSEFDTDIIIVIIVVGVVLLVLACVGYLAWRFGDRLRTFFIRFLALDILVVFCVGGGWLFFILFRDLRIPTPMPSFFVLVWNFGMVGLVSMYGSLPPNQHVHRMFLICLMGVMAVMLLLTLPTWINLAFLVFAALLDVVSELRPDLQLLAPVILPTSFELLYQTPRMVYHVGNIRVRSLDILWYGILVGLVAFTVKSLSMVIIASLATMALLTFVVPYLGRLKFGFHKARPLPAAVVAAACLMLWYENLLGLYLMSFVRTVDLTPPTVMTP